MKRIKRIIAEYGMNALVFKSTMPLELCDVEELINKYQDSTGITEEIRDEIKQEAERVFLQAFNSSNFELLIRNKARFQQKEEQIDLSLFPSFMLRQIALGIDRNGMFKADSYYAFATYSAVEKHTESQKQEIGKFHQLLEKRFTKQQKIKHRFDPELAEKERLVEAKRVIGEYAEQIADSNALKKFRIQVVGDISFLIERRLNSVRRKRKTANRKETEASNESVASDRSKIRTVDYFSGRH